MGFNESLPFANERFKFVRGKGHSGEICQTVFALDFIDAEFDFTEGMLLVILEICKGNFKDTTFECVVGGFYISTFAYINGRILKPVDRLTRVLPTCLTSKIPGALTSYLEKESQTKEKLNGCTNLFLNKGLRPSFSFPSFLLKDAYSCRQPE